MTAPGQVRARSEEVALTHPSPAPALGLPAVPAPRLPHVRRLAVLRGGGLGDLLVAEPAISALRAAYPEAEVVLLGAAHHRALVEARPGPVDRLEPVPLVHAGRVGDDPHGDPGLEEWCAARRGEGFDLAVQVHGGGRHSNPLVARLGAATTVGPATPDAVRPDRWLPYTAYQPDVLRWLEVAAAAGAPSLRLEPRLAVTDADVAASRERLPDADRPLVAVHPGATDPRRRWLPQRLGRVAARLGERGARVVVLGAPDEAALAAEVAAAAGPGALDLAGRLTLPGVIGLLSRSALFLGNDSGPRHIAAAVGTPTVGVFTNANLADVAPLARTWHRLAVSWRSACSLCGLGFLEGECGHGETVLADVEVDEVSALAVDLWAQVLAAGRLPGSV